MVHKIFGILQTGLIKLLKITWIVLKSFGEAITWDFFNNVRKYWKKTFKKAPVESKKSAPGKDHPIP